MRAVAVVLALALGPACADEPTPQIAAAEASNVVAPVVSPSATPAYARPQRVGELVAHVRVADPAALLAKLEPLLPEAFTGRLAPEAVRARLADGASPLGTAMIGHLEFERAAGCALLGPTSGARGRTLPIACVFGYEGGLDGLRDDLGPQGVTADGQAALEVERGGSTWFFDPLGDRVVFATHADAFEASRAYLETLSRPGGERDIEVVLHTAYAATAYREELSALLVAAALAAQPATELRTGAGPDVTDALLDVLDAVIGWAVQVDDVALYANATDDGVVVGVQATPTQGGALSRSLEVAESIDPAVWAWLPNGTWLTWASRREPGGGPQSRVRALGQKFLTHYLARFLDRPPADLAAAADALTLAQAELYGDWTLFAAYNSPATRGGAMLVRPNKAGAQSRPRWLAMARAATPQAVLGQELASTLQKTVTWDVFPATATLRGLTVDEWRLMAAPSLLSSLERSLAEGSIGRDIVAALRGRNALVSIQRFEMDGAVVFTFAPGGGVAYATKVIGAKNGVGRLPRTGLDAITAGHSKTLAIGAFSGFDLLRAVRESLPPDALVGLPSTLGRDLSDASFTASIGPQGAVRYELSISTSVLAGLRQLLRYIVSAPADEKRTGD